MSKLRFRVVETAFKKKAVEVATPAERPSEYFGKYVFNKEKMKVQQMLIQMLKVGVNRMLIMIKMEKQQTMESRRQRHALYKKLKIVQRE